MKGLLHRLRARVRQHVAPPPPVTPEVVRQRDARAARDTRARLQMLKLEAQVYSRQMADIVEAEDRS